MLVPGLAPSSTSAWRSHFDNVIGWTPKSVGDLLERHTGIAVAGDPDDVVTELTGIRLGHSDILPARPTGQASSDVTYPCSRPKRSQHVCALGEIHAVHGRQGRLSRLHSHRSHELLRHICIACAADDRNERIAGSVGFDPLDEAAGDSLGKVFDITFGGLDNTTSLAGRHRKDVAMSTSEVRV